MLCSGYLVANERVEHTSPVHDAVRSVGYLLGEEQVTVDEHERHVLPSATAAAECAEGSSIKEEPDVEPTYDHPPVYTHPEKHYPAVKIGPHGYAVSPLAFS